LTLLLIIPPDVSELRRAFRQSTMPFVRDRLEEGDRQFFARVARGYEVIAAAEPGRVRVLDGAGSVENICGKIWEIVQPRLPKVGRW
jgi:dTMP kinase